jgi:hypothetical protein
VGVCTRHHCIDWNFVGAARPRPNKWRVQPCASSQEGVGGGVKEPIDEWLELSFADDDAGSPYYFEKWARRLDTGTEESEGLLGGSGTVHGVGGRGGGVPPSAGRRQAVALRALAAPGGGPDGNPARDAMLIIAGDHFAYVVARPVPYETLRPLGGTLFSVVDEAVRRGQRGVAEACLQLEAGHGRVGAGWLIDASLQPWRIGRPLASVFGGEGTATAAARSVLTLEALLEGSAAGRPLDGQIVCVGAQAFEVQWDE